MQRNKDRKFRHKVGEEEIELNGYSPAEIQRVLKMVDEERQKRVAEAKEDPADLEDRPS